MNAWNKFSDPETRNYTMSDMINFAEQVLIALKDFYLSVGFLHRDLKDLNILISDDGVIKIIDNGSVFPYFDMQELWNPSRK
jgi:serine/threonine protein kinase